MNAIGAILTAVCAAIVMFGSRQMVLVGLFGAVCYITQGQQFDLGGMNFTAIRFILLAGLIRVQTHGDLKRVRWNGIDKAFFAHIVILSVCMAYRVSGKTNPRDPTTMVTILGGAYDVILSYIIFRCLVSSLDDVKSLISKLAWLVTPLAIAMLIEGVTGSNLFSSMGGWDAEGWVRDGRRRCVGSFRGPHTAGIFGATLMPLFAYLLVGARQRTAAVAGLVSASIITYTANSSGPLSAYMSGLVAFAFWPLRRRMRMVRWGIGSSLLLLHLAMKPPIWYLMSKISDLTGGDGWHRAYLMDMCAKTISRWWLIGTDETADWARTLMSWGGADLCNYYVSAAAGGGIASLIFFILVLIRSFRNLGNSVRAMRTSSREAEILFWCLGSALFAHVVCLFSITYSDQMYVPWWGLLGMISGVTSAVLAPKLVPAEVTVDDPLVVSANKPEHGDVLR